VDSETHFRQPHTYILTYIHTYIHTYINTLTRNCRTHRSTGGLRGSNPTGDSTRRTRCRNPPNKSTRHRPTRLRPRSISNSPIYRRNDHDPAGSRRSTSESPPNLGWMIRGCGSGIHSTSARCPMDEGSVLPSLEPADLFLGMETDCQSLDGRPAPFR
jgi:hypothetical protein